MNKGWKESTLDDFVQINPRESIRKGSIATKVSMDCLQAFTKKIVAWEEEEFKGGTKFRNGDTIMARITPCLQNGKTSYVDILSEHEIAFGSTEYIVFRSREHISDSGFIYYLVTSPTLRRIAIQSMTGSTGRQRVQIDVLRNHLFHLPPLPEQKAIAHILGRLDDKIELNRRMNETLEAMAQALFRSWFVNFDPVLDNALASGQPIPEALQAKAEGRKAVQAQAHHPQLPEEIKALFPNRFVFSDVLGKWIPEGWEVGRVGDLCIKIQNGGTPKRSNSEFWNDGSIPWLSSGEVRKTIIPYTSSFITEKGLEKSSAKWLPKYSTVVAMYGATAGQVAFTSINLTTNQAVCGLIPKEGFKYFNFLRLRMQVEILANQARGSAQQNISKGIIENTKVVIPEQRIIDFFEMKCDPIFSKWIFNFSGTATLTQLRDTLLPQLISGKLSVADFAEQIDGALVDS